MEGRFSEEELMFVRDVLHQHGDYLVSLLQEDIDRKKIRNSDALMQSIHTEVSNEGINPVLLLSFKSYGRALEIRYHKRSDNTKKWTTDTNREVWGMSRKKLRRKDTLFYTRNVYGSLNRLIGVLGSEFSEKEIKRIKKVLEHEKIRASV